jgi:hypothetical protein
MSTESRQFLLREIRRFCKTASNVSGVKKISLIGSLTTDKDAPKDADLVVTIGKETDLEELAIAGRKIKGKAQSKNMGADIFLCDEHGNYLGRTCSWRECHVRVACRGNQCHLGTYLCDDLQVVNLNSSIVAHPPLEIWPRIVQRGSLPRDVEESLVKLSPTA